MPIFSLGLMVKDTFLSTRGRFSRYRISAFSKTTSPSCGQSRGGALFLIRAGASRERVFKKKRKVQFPVNKALKRKAAAFSSSLQTQPTSVCSSFQMNGVAGYCHTRIPCCCLNNDIGPSSQQCFSSIELKMYFRPIFYVHNVIEFSDLPKIRCDICYISVSLWLCCARVSSVDSDTEENTYVNYCTNIILLFLILSCFVKSLSQSGPFQLTFTVTALSNSPSFKQFTPYEKQNFYKSKGYLTCLK